MTRVTGVFKSRQVVWGSQGRIEDQLLYTHVRRRSAVERRLLGTTRGCSTLQVSTQYDEAHRNTKTAQRLSLPRLLFPPSASRLSNPRHRPFPKAYRSASPQEKEAFHETGLRRLSNEKVAMPSGRVLEDSDKVRRTPKAVSLRAE